MEIVDWGEVTQVGTDQVVLPLNQVRLIFVVTVLVFAFI